ncbi:MAG TPA: ThiF family adenylyltransferase [Dehalococcoidales bacterium]|jgi:molybdopterin/thiamine biosynthesis adenylyltransferase|nr:ThiF family adenylyltransferase [Dehalococcoidales bacterium]
MQKREKPSGDNQADTLYKEIFFRNSGLISETEQNILRRSSVAIAGVGGVGGLLAERLVRIGIGRIKITDPGTFEKSNFNRQFGSSMNTLDQNKAEVVYQQLKDINPNAEILYDKVGISDESSANKFIHDADMIIDEMDFGMFKQSIRLQRAARQQNKYYFFSSAIGYGALIAIFDPKGLTLEEFDGLPANADLDSIEKLKISLERVMPLVPAYIKLAARQVLQEVYAGKRAVPTSSVGVGLTSILTANEAINILFKKREITIAPHYLYIDLMDQRFIVGNMQTANPSNVTFQI